jgi:hypothetical protein
MGLQYPTFCTACICHIVAIRSAAPLQDMAIRHCRWDAYVTEDKWLRAESGKEEKAADGWTSMDGDMKGKKIKLKARYRLC